MVKGGVNMARKSKRICYNLKSSDISVTVGKLTFYFSKDLNAIKFNARLNDYIEHERYKLSGKYLIPIDANDYFALRLYMDIENYGFRVRVKGSDSDCHSVNQVRLDGEIKTKENCNVS